MKKPVPPDDLWDVLDEQYESMKPPANTFTVNDLVKRYKNSYSACDNMITRLLKSGVAVEVGKFTGKSGRITKFYRLSGKK